jgi:hypothetical protein
MFEWLENEMGQVNTPKFYIVDGPAPAELREAIEHSDVAPPPSYEAFVLQFGNAKLYRQGSVYLVQVFASLLDAESDEGETLLQFGRTDMSLAYFKESLLIRGRESPVFEWRHELGLQNTADFSVQEKAIVEARKLFRWRVVGIAPNGDLRFEVHNGSNLVLPYFSIGIRGKLRPPKSGPLNGGVWLPVSSILPGDTQIIEKGCYKNLVDPKDIEAFAEPDPEPEDRDRYWEFRSL